MVNLNSDKGHDNYIFYSSRIKTPKSEELIDLKIFVALFGNSGNVNFQANYSEDSRGVYFEIIYSVKKVRGKNGFKYQFKLEEGSEDSSARLKDFIAKNSIECNSQSDEWKTASDLVERLKSEG